MSQLSNFASRVVPLPVDDVDTDQIIPARFLKVTDKSGLGENLFADWRRNADGALRVDFPLNRREHAGAEILLAGNNFGCGSSREHAPWALVGHGIRAVVATSFADIFRQNALKNGLLPVVVDRATSAALFAAVAADPSTLVSIDLDAQTIEHAPTRTRATFALDPFAKHCLATGTDELGYLLAKAPAIAAFEASHG